MPSAETTALRDLLARAEHLPLTLLGLYAVGPAVLGEAQDDGAAGCYLAVVEERPDEAAVAQLGSLHADLRASGVLLSGSWAVRADLSSPMGLGRRWWAVDHDADAPVLSARDNCATARWVLRERGVVVAGPPAADLVAPVPLEVLGAEGLGLARTRGEGIEEDPALLEVPATRDELVGELGVALHAATTGEVAGRAAALAWCAGELDDVPTGRESAAADVRRFVWEVHARIGTLVSTRGSLG